MSRSRSLTASPNGQCAFVVPASACLSPDSERLLASQRESLLDSLASLSLEQQNSKLLDSHYHLSRELFLMKERLSYYKQRDAQCQSLAQQLNVQAQAMSQLVQQFDSLANVDSLASSSSAINANGSVAFNASLSGNAAGSLSYEDYRTMLAVTQSEIDRRQQQQAGSQALTDTHASAFAAPHRHQLQSASLSLTSDSASRTAAVSLYDSEGQLTRRGLTIIHSVFSMFASTNTMTFDDLQRLANTVHQVPTDATTGSEGKKDSDDHGEGDEDELWYLWQSYAASNEGGEDSSDTNGGGLSESELAAMYCAEAAWNLDADASRLGLM